MGIDERKKRWRDLYSRKAKTLVLIDYPLPGRPWPYPENMQARLDWASESYRRQLHNMEWLDDDRIPALHLYTGTELFAEAFGCKVHYPGNDMPFALPIIGSAGEVAAIKPPDIYGACLGEIFELARRLRQRNGDAILHLPDIQSPLDIAALIWDKNDLLIAMLEDAPAVQGLIEMIEHTLTKFLDAWRQEFGTEYIAHYPDYYMDSGITLSEDEIGTFSPAMFEEYCLGPLNRLSARYNGIGIHCCANATFQWENMKKITGLKMLNICQPPEVSLKAYEYFADTTAMMYGWCGDGAPSVEWANNYPKDAHVVISCAAQTRDEAVMYCDILREIVAMRG